jgi:hypothetical protein
MQEPSWYGTAQSRLRTIADEYGITLETVAGVCAALSPNNRWSQNIRDTRRYCEANKRKVLSPDIGAGTYTKNREKACRILRGEAPLDVLGGPKVRAFYLCLLGHTEHVVIDFHMANLLSGEGRKTLSESKSVSNKLYGVLACKLAIGAKEAGLSNADYQAQLWIAHRDGLQQRMF